MEAEVFSLICSLLILEVDTLNLFYSHLFNKNWLFGFSLRCIYLLKYTHRIWTSFFLYCLKYLSPDFLEEDFRGKKIKICSFASSNEHHFKQNFLDFTRLTLTIQEELDLLKFSWPGKTLDFALFHRPSKMPLINLLSFLIASFWSIESIWSIVWNSTLYQKDILYQVFYSKDFKSFSLSLVYLYDYFKRK